MRLTLCTIQESNTIAKMMLTQIKATSLAENLFVVGVCIGTLVPRLSGDKSCWTLSVGGNLSYYFRLLLLVLTLMNVFRAFAFSDDGFASDKHTPVADTIYFVMNASEAFGKTFLCLLTPYLIKETVKGTINPGRLMPWLCIVLFLQILGMSLTLVYHLPQYWCIKRFGDILSGIPVLTAIAEYNQVHMKAEADGQKPRGTMVFQTIVTVEYLNMIATAFALVGYYMATSSLGSALYSEIDHTQAISVALRTIGIYANWVRVFCHGMLLNTIDESQYRQFKRVPERDYAPASHGSGNNESFEDDTPVLIHELSPDRTLVRRGSTMSCSP